MGSSGSMDPKSLTFRMLEEITDDFSEERALGQGAYGKVYKGVRENGEVIAVKCFYNTMQAIDDKQFQREFHNLMMLNHENIVKLVGYCYETQHRHVYFHGKTVFAETTYKALCLEYMGMGSLKRHLSDEFSGFDWQTRYKIIKGTCEGLKYLHEGFKDPIYHLDLKPDNILLDENMLPKLADFGLSKLFDEEQTRVTHSPIGTIGYMPPEYLYRHVVSKKLDVFSLGVVMTQIIAGPTGHTRSAEMTNQEFLDQVHKNWMNRLEPTCHSLPQLEAYCHQVSICTELGVSCMEFEKDNRPSIVDVIDKLDETEAMIKKATPVKSQRENDDDLVKVEAFPRNKAISIIKTCNKFPVLVRVTGASWRRPQEMPRAGVDVVVALNIWLNAVKEAMMMLVDRLSPNDRLGISYCGYSVKVMELTYMSDKGRHDARLNINDLADNQIDYEDLYRSPAREKAAQILRQRGVEEGSTRAGCIMHVSGENPGIHEKEISQEFPVHRIALGIFRPNKPGHDITSGTYSFVKQHDFDNIEYAIALFMASVTSVAGIKITLQAEEGVTISSIASGHCGNLVSSDKRSGTVDLHSISDGEQKNFIVYLKVTKGKEKLITIGGGYQLSLNRSKELVGMDVVVARPHRNCLPDEMIIHPKVAAELLRIRLMEGIAKKNQDLSSNSLRLLLDKIKNSHEGHAAPEEILSDLEEEVAEMMDRYGVDRESMLSSLNCHQLQRSTTKGMPPGIGAFQILEQQRADEHNNLLKIEGFTRCKAIMCKGERMKFAVMVRVTMAPWRLGTEMPRDGVDVVAVLDASRDMQGERLELVKQAMLTVIEKLGPHDRLSVVSFQASKHRLMELTYLSDDHAHSRHTARLTIIQMKASGGNIPDVKCDIASAALQEGFQILLDRGAEESNSRLGCIILLSDGKYPEILQRRINPQFPVHTFGLGADHNPMVMNYIADTTSGTYSFVDQDINNINNALALFITGLTSIAATSIKITLRTHSAPISSIESGNYINSVGLNNNYGTIIIDQIYAGEQKEFIVNLLVWRKSKKLMTINGEYKILKRNNSLAEMEISVIRPRWLDDLTIHPHVAAELTRIRLQKGILDMLETQKMTTQGLQQLWNMIKHSKEGRAAPEETLSGLSMDVAEMNRDIPGMPYTLSWLSCHKWQRATTKGMPSNSSAFQTIGQYGHEDTNLVKVETFTRSKTIPSDEPCNKFPVLVRVTVVPRPHAEEISHAGVDVVAVLDASGGMQGEKLERMKEAMMVVIDKLRAEDRLSIVSFNTYDNRLTSLTYMTDHGRDVARLKINKLVAGGQGDIAAGLREGAEILWWREAESSRRVGCIVFLSDNHEIFQTEIRPEFPVHAFGLGTDHNPSMMKHIADVTSGTYSFVNEDIGMIKDALALFIAGLTSVAAMSIKITLRTDEGIIMSSIESGGYVNHVKSNQFGTIEIDNIYTGERKDFIVYLRVAERRKELMTIGGQYLSHKTVKHLAYTDVCVQRPRQECVPGDLAIHPEVAAELVQIRLEKGISTMLQKGLTIVGLEQLWKEIMNSEEGRGTPKETLSGLRMDITEMKRDIEIPNEHRKSGLPYTLSWLTSRKWQRATIKGTLSNYGAIKTTGQDPDGRTTLSR